MLFRSAISKLSAVAADAAAGTPAQLAALQALEAIGDGRSLATAMTLAGEPGDVGLGAVALIGAVARAEDTRATRAFEWLAALVLDRSAAEARRLAALSALEGASPRHVKPLYQALADDPGERLAARAQRRNAGQTASLDRAIVRGLPEDPAVVSAMIRDEADATNVTTLRRLIDIIRERESAAAASERGPWTAARGLVHQALAARKSRLALYDVREALEHADGPLPAGFLAAAAAVGDISCLDPLAAAWIASPVAHRWWREHLAEAFRAIVSRERLTRRHPALKKILEKRPAAAVLVAEAKKT